MKIIYASLLATTLLMLSSCATLISGSRQTVEIKSIPSNAKIYIDSVEWGNTPIEKSLLRNHEYHIMLELDGYKTYETKLVRSFNAWYLGNVFLGGFIGLLIDPATGAIYKLQPERFNGVPKSGTSFKNGGESLFITISMDVDSSLEKVGQLDKYE